MRQLFVINPNAGKGLNVESVHQEIEQIMASRTDDWEIKVTEKQGDAVRFAEAAAAQAEETGENVRIYALGGDGTLNEVVNGAAGREHVEIACCPMGSGNDFVKAFGKDAWKFRDLKALVEGESYPLDLIDCNGRQSINICSVGFDARIGLEQAMYKNLPLVTGKGAYLISAVSNIIKGIHRHYRLEVDGKQLEGDYTLIAACNGQWYGGSFHPAPDAVLDDGLLDFLVVEGVSRFTVASLIGKYANGRGKDYPDLIHIYRGKEMKVMCDQLSMVNIDGERVDAISLSFKVSAKKVNVIVPAGHSWKPSKMRKEEILAE